MEEAINKRIGDYEILRELGHGGMGRVYQVRNVLTDRVEAMKVLLPDLAARDEFVNRFMREIKVLASLDHPNIAALRTAFTSGDQFVMVMEYVEGTTLAERLERGKFLPAEALNYIDQVLAALSYAHAKHVIHRDIKPANMMLTPQGVVKLMDFGLARVGDEIGLTATGSTLGSLDYMSPEQVKAQLTDERSDLYSVGVSLYQMVTRQRMFSATSSYSLMEAQIKETPRAPIEIQPDLPRSLSDLIMMAIAKEPEQRFQSADAFRNAAAQIRANLVQSASATATAMLSTASGAAVQPVTASASSDIAAGSAQPKGDPGFVPAPRPSAGRGWMMAVAVVILLALAGGVALYKSRQHDNDTNNVSAANKPQDTTPGSTPATPAPPPVQDANASAPPVQDSSTDTPSNSPLNQPPAPKSSKAARYATSASSAMSAGSQAPDTSAADAQAAQQAALEHQKLMDSLETESDQLDSRASAVESSLDALEQQMHQSGLGLRGDMVAARSNMRSDLAKAKQALDSSDTDRAKHFLDMAQHEVEKLEAFVGRR